MSTVLRGSNLASIDARLKGMFFESKGGIPIISDKITKVVKTDRAYELFSGWYGVDEAAVVDENAVFPTKEIKTRATKTVNVKKFGFTILVSREQIMDAIFQNIQDNVAKAMRNSMVQTKERRALNLLNNGFTTQLTYDGVSLFNTAHPLGQGGTQSNAATVASALDVDSLWSGINTLKTMKGNSTLFDAIYEPRYIPVPQILERRAHELVSSEWVPQVTENTENVVKNLYPLQPLASPLLTSNTAWFLTANPSDPIDYGLVILQREALSIKALFDAMNDTELGLSVDRDIFSWRVRERYECDTPTTWYGLYGNAGA